jgi:inhibitor of KinA
VWTPTVSPLGDRALTIDLSHADGASPRDLIRSLDARIRADAPPGVVALVPAIRTLTLHYEPSIASWSTLHGYLAHAFDTLVLTSESAPEPVVIPVCYGGQFGPDLEFVAQVHATTPDAINAAHTAGTYTVAMIGFLPGFPYLDGLAPALHTPRRAEPRTSVPAGSVGIGGSSTGVYPFASPGGWHLIGRTPLALFDPVRNRPSLLVAGDAVRFIAVPASDWRDRA